MDIGHFYFIDNKFFIDFPDSNLMQNHGITGQSIHNRPCFYAINDDKGIYWIIPISSKVDKYKKIYSHKISKYGYCDTIDFAYVLGQERTFLIQNMFPITQDYILNEYMDNLNNSVMIADISAKRIIHKSKKILALQRKGYKIIYGDPLRIELQLKENIKQQQSIACSQTSDNKNEL